MIGLTQFSEQRTFVPTARPLTWGVRERVGSTFSMVILILILLPVSSSGNSRNIQAGKFYSQSRHS